MAVHLKYFFALVLISLSSGFAAFRNHFGATGYDGRPGRDGADGIAGVDRTLIADGSSFVLDLSGTRGERGERGEDGEHATSCYQPHEPHHNLEGADGGKGGRGGRGGNGGSSGDLTAYFADSANLKRIEVRATPGDGGRGAWGGRGGSGCRCTHYSWTVTVGEQTHTYHCTDGRSGTKGSDGRDGTDGRYGEVRVIPQLTPLQGVAPYRTVSMEAMEGGPFSLSNNLWEARTGAKALFAQSSDLNDRYLFFLRRVDLTYGFVWGVNRPLEDFTGEPIHLSLPKETVHFSLPRTIWFTGNESVDPTGHTTFTFEQAIYEREALNLNVVGASGSGTNLELSLADASKLSHVVRTSFSIDYLTKGVFVYQSRYKGDVPENLALQDTDNFRILVGKLPIPSKYLKSGKNALMKVTVKRSLGEHSGKQHLEKYYKIP